MTALAELPATREGQGWGMDILPESIIIRLAPHDETALQRALEDLASWSDPTEWDLVFDGFDDNDNEICLLLWVPSITSW